MLGLGLRPKNRTAMGSGEVHYPPVASFTTDPSPAMGDIPLSVAFTDTSLYTPDTWLWEVTGGEEGTDYEFTVGDETSQNPTISFLTVGEFSVKLTASNDYGSSESAPTLVDTTENPFNPADYGTVITWLKNAVAMTGAQWSDQSGNNNNAVQSSATKRPTYNPTGINSLPTLDFDGVDDFMSFGTSLGKPANFTTIAVYFVTDISVINRLCGAYDGSNSSLWGSHTISNVVVGGVLDYNSDGAAFSNGNTDPILSNNIPVIVATKYTAGQTTRKIFLNGTSKTVNDISQAASTNEGAAANYSLGRLGDLDAQYFGGSVAEFIVFSSAVSDADIITIANYYKTKFAIS